MELYSANPGPVDSSVLYDQDKHVSSAVWEGQERGALRCHEHTSKLDQWMLTNQQIELVEKAGFAYLRLIPAISLDNPLISALVERWRKETNTFHLNVGEMTVTLEDVAYLLGLAIDGEPVIGVTYTTCELVCLKYLGRAPESKYTSGGMVKLSWLKEFFSPCPVDASQEDIERHTRAYLLYLVGSTIFSTTTGNKVPVMYLQLFENFDRAGKYAWGAAALAFLYRALGNASLRSQSTISGCLTLLQCWSWYHINIGRPRLAHERNHGLFPLLLKWKGKQSGPTSNRDLTYYRKALDSLQPSDVEWIPYNVHSTLLPEAITSNLILGRSKTMLICFDKAERHLPDRCRRQYGMRQPIPADVQRWERKSRGVDGGVDLSVKMDAELIEWSERRLHIVEDDEGVYESEYMQWYFNITRKFVGRPVPLSSEFQRMNAALRDIAHLADAVSTHGMDDHQLHSVTRIRYIVHDCLRDQVGDSMVVVSSPQDDLPIRVRGKEKVRRKGSGKRKRRDDSEQLILCEYEGDQEELTSMTCEVNELQLCHVDGEHMEFYDDLSKGEGMQLSHVADEVDKSQLCDIVADINHSQLCTVDVVNESQICSISEVENAHLCSLDAVDNSRLCIINEVDDSQLFSATDESDVKPPATHLEVVPLSALESSEEVAQQTDRSVLV